MGNILGPALLAVVALLSTGCAKGPDLVGKWNGTVSLPLRPAAKVPADLEFKPDNTVVMTCKVGSASLSVTSDYKLEGAKLTITGKDVQVTGIDATHQAEAKAATDRLVGHAETATVKISGDEMALTDAKNSTQIFKRVKEDAQ